LPITAPTLPSRERCRLRLVAVPYPPLALARLARNEVHARSADHGLARAFHLQIEEKLDLAPSFIQDWRARQDSNLLPLGS
jgi:hypothetical protein